MEMRHKVIRPGSMEGKSPEGSEQGAWVDPQRGWVWEEKSRAITEKEKVEESVGF